MQNQECEILCSKNYTEFDIDNFKWMIERDYHYTFYIDDLPSAFVSRNKTLHDDDESVSDETKGKTVRYENGIPVGSWEKEKGEYYINNHLDFTVQVHETLDDKDSFRIVGFKVEPIS